MLCLGCTVALRVPLCACCLSVCVCMCALCVRCVVLFAKRKTKPHAHTHTHTPHKETQARVSVDVFSENNIHTLTPIHTLTQPHTHTPHATHTHTHAGNLSRCGTPTQREFHTLHTAARRLQNCQFVLFKESRSRCV